MRVLFVGDIVGRAGRKILKENLGLVCHRHNVDFIILNVENAAGGFGITKKIAEEFLRLQVDVMTSGNHIWDNQDAFSYLDSQPLLLRPANYPPGLPGSGSCITTSQTGISVAVLNLQGRVFMQPLDCPFRTAETLIDSLKTKADVIIVD
ncbi:MAG: YmdB family metallophosphoesterase, partial [Acidobacteriota bacterium]